MLYALDKAQLLRLFTANAKSHKNLAKPDKVFLGNPNLMHVLCPIVEKGNERETFFFSQTIVTNNVKYPRRGDFLVDDKYLLR